MAIWQQRGHLGTNWFHAFNLLESLSFFFVPQESQQATEPLLTLAVIQLVQIVISASQEFLTHCSMMAHAAIRTKVLVCSQMSCDSTTLLATTCTLGLTICHSQRYVVMLGTR